MALTTLLNVLRVTLRNLLKIKIDTLGSKGTNINIFVTFNLV